MKPTIVLAALGLTACSTMSIAELEQRAPAAIFSTDRPPAAVAACLAETLGHLGAPLIIERPNGRRVTFTLQNNTSAAFEIEPGRVEARVISRVVPFRRKTAECI